MNGATNGNHLHRWKENRGDLNLFFSLLQVVDQDPLELHTRVLRNTPTIRVVQRESACYTFVLRLQKRISHFAHTYDGEPCQQRRRGTSCSAETRSPNHIYHEE
jgi:hypothetical protein